MRFSQDFEPRAAARVFRRSWLRHSTARASSAAASEDGEA
jgi:hypothetical protein